MIDLQPLRDAVRQAGRLALAHWPGDGHAVRVWDKRPGDPVSDADLRVNDFLHEALSRVLPQAGWLSEESANDPAQRTGEWAWIVDPIDGTRDFVRGRAGWAVSVALVRSGELAAAVLEAPARGEHWWALAGAGAWRNDARLRVSGRPALSGARVPAADLARADGLFARVPQPNSIALRLGMVAAGEADLVATYRWGHVWDIAAATLLVREAGGMVADALGVPPDFRTADGRVFGVVASTPALLDPAVSHIAERARAALLGT
ncbi:3'(2'),5'-bisphosphate nucleotidase CysQ [Erythrobacteraceae bacterium CFH 75059]|nr:3'(2'),5'-bisphosphate nucleotidase CysQ [Erythrobacteraceae bacterium CFH 75059]